MSGPRSNERIYASTYNELNQAKRLEEQDSGAIEYLGRLRLDVIVFRTVVIPVNYITDGRFFLSVNPAALLDSMSRTAGAVGAPLEVITAGKSFDDALRSIFHRDEYLHSVVFDSIGDPQVRDALAKDLRTVKKTAFDSQLHRQESTPKAIGGLLRRLLAREGIDPGGDIERLERGWANWQTVFDGRVSLTNRVGPLRLVDALASGYLPPDTLTDFGRQVLNEVARMARSNVAHRSDFRLFFAKARSTASEEADLHQIELIEDYTERAWERSVAAIYTCSYAYEPTPGDPDDARLTKLISALTSEDEYLPPGVFRHLGLLPNARFQAFAGMAQEDLVAWWSKRDESSLRRVMDRLVLTLDREGLVERDDDQKVADLLISIPNIAAGAATAWGIGQAAGLGSAIGDPAGSVVSVLGTLGAVYATRRFKSRHKRQTIARLVEYGNITRGSS